VDPVTHQEHNDMTNPVKMIPAALLLAGAGLTTTGLAVTPQEQLDIESQCRADAETYAIPPEQMAEYIDGCILSMGGQLSSPAQDAAIQDSAPAGAPPDEDTFAVEPMEPGDPDAVPEYSLETP
jgi:hypothetical protein